MEKDVNVSGFYGFQWWRRKQQQHYLGFFLLITGTIVFLTTVLWMAGFDTFRKSDVFWGCACLILFEVVALRYLIIYFRLFRIHPEQYELGIIRDKRKLKLPNRRVKGYQITISAGGKIVNAVCLKKTYYLAKPGQHVLVFTIGRQAIHCVHPEM